MAKKVNNIFIYYLLFVIIEQSIQQKIAEKQRPLTLNVLKDF